MTAKVIIFDFDGTIADSLDALVNITNNLALEFGYKPTSQDEIDYLKNLNYRELIKLSGISIFKLPFLLKKVKSELNIQIQTLSTFPGIKEALLALKKQGNKIGIVSSNSEDNIVAFLQTNELKEIFDFIYSAATILGKSRVINNLLKQQNINPAAVIYVGDEIRDIEAARRSGIKAIAVTWGFNSKELLAKHNPDYLLHQPHELIGAITSWQK